MSECVVDDPHWDPQRGGPWSAAREWVYDPRWDVPPSHDLPALLAGTVLFLVCSCNIHEPGGARNADERHPWLHALATKGTMGVLGRRSHPRPHEGWPKTWECTVCEAGFTTTIPPTAHKHVCPVCSVDTGHEFPIETRGLEMST